MGCIQGYVLNEEDKDTKSALFSNQSTSSIYIRICDSVRNIQFIAHVYSHLNEILSLFFMKMHLLCRKC